MNIQQILESLSFARPIFHSEADFQHALAWQIHLLYADADIRLEYPTRIHDDLLAHLDIFIRRSKLSVAIELKYKTRKYQNGEFNLTDQYAQDLARYDFIKDISRLEETISNRKARRAYAIFLTNDKTYWNESRRANPIDANFRINEDRNLNGRLSWSPEASESSIRGRQEILNITGNYDLHWKNYSNLHTTGNSIFRYLLVKI